MNEIFNSEALNNYQNNWNDVGTNSSALTNLFDNMFGWVNSQFESHYKTIDQVRNEMLTQNPNLDITNLDDGFALEAERLNAIAQKKSKGFTIIDINPGLLTQQNYPYSMPYEFLFDGTNFIPADDGSLVKNFRSIPIDIAGNFVKVEYIYENNSEANVGNTSIFPIDSRPYASRKYTQALKNFFIINGTPYYYETDLISNYKQYDFDNFARNKVYLGFDDTIAKPHLINRSGDSFNTYFKSLYLHLNIGAPKIRITIGFNSEKFDGPSDAAINSKLALMGSARMFRDSDTVLNPFNFNLGDNFDPYAPFGLGLAIGAVITNIKLLLLSNRGQSDNNTGGRAIGYSLLFINGIQFNVRRNTAAQVSFKADLMCGPSNDNTNSVRLYSINLELSNADVFEAKENTYTPSEAIRCVIPDGCSLWLNIYAQSSVAAQIVYNFSFQGYSYGQLRKLVGGGFGFINTSKFITDSTFLSDYNRVDSIRNL